MQIENDPGESEFDAAFQEALAEEPPPPADVSGLGQRLLSEFERRKSERNRIELRWLQDIRQYNGQYEPEFESYLKERKTACKVYVPLTRRICNIVEARISDLLFPTDDRNFVISPSPMPELGEASELMKQVDPAQPLVIDGQPVEPTAVGNAIAQVIDEARRKAMNMQRVVDDQLAESNWPTEARKVMHDAVKMGTGVVKGPFVLNKTKKRWTMVNGIRTLTVTNSEKPAIKRVDPWNFYPETGAANMDENGSTFERHPMNKVQLLELADQGFDFEAIRRVVQSGPKYIDDSNIDATKEASGTMGIERERYNVVEYNGPVDAEDLRTLGVDIPDDDTLVFEAVVFFSEFTGDVLKAIIRPISSTVTMYSVFNWQPDSASIWGYGVPYEIRDMQESANSSYRAAHDNMALAVGPQIVVNSKKIQPMNDSWQIESMKLWDLKDSSVPVSNVFGFFQIDSRLNELMNLFNLSKQLAEEIGGPMLAMQGQDAPSYVQTATGMSIAYNAANIWMRRAVKLWDDQVTVPRISAFIEWNMEHHPDEDIKGDLNVIARGTSALLEAEGQVQRLQMLNQASQAAGIPIRRQINQLRQMALAMRLDPAETLPSDEEVEEMERNQQPPPNPELERIRIRELELQDNQEERAFRAQQTEENNRIRMIEIASRENLTMEQVRQKYGFELQVAQMEDKRERDRMAIETQKFNAELVTKAQHGSGV